jgi:hypothetical protein
MKTKRNKGRWTIERVCDNITKIVCMIMDHGFEYGSLLSKKEK